MQPASITSKHPVENKQSRLLTNEENQQVFKLLNTGCQSLVTSVIELYETQPPSHSAWIRKDAGVLCFVKDNARRNYFFRFYCIKRNKLLWEQEIYYSMEYVVSCPFLHTFEAELCMAAFNFANEDEAKEMKHQVDAKLALKRKREVKRLRLSQNNNRQLNVVNTASPEGVGLKGRRRGRHLTKADIGNPLEFRHVSHVGWSPNSGFAVNIKDSALSEIFRQAGISETQLKDKSTREFIYDFISLHDHANLVKSEQVTSRVRRPPPAVPPPPVIGANSTSTANAGLAGPPVPPRGGLRVPHSRIAPPPPPSVTQAAPQHNNVQPPRPSSAPKIVPPAPPSNAPAPPPPPPMMVSTRPPPPPSAGLPMPQMPSEITQSDGRSALLESIRSGTTLRPVAPAVEKKSEDARGDLLSEIRKGFQLKPANEREMKPISPAADQQMNGVNDLAAALSRALAERSRVIQTDDESDSSSSNADDDWDD